MGCSWDKVVLGSSGLRVSSLGIGSSYGVGGEDLERAFDRGINFFFWGLRRRGRFAEGVISVATRHRDEIVVAVQSYSRAACLVRPSIERALKRLRMDYADLLVLGMWNKPPPARIVEAAVKLRDAGRVRHIGVSCHDRPNFPVLASDPLYDVLMVRYNAAHPGAEHEVFPHVPRPGPGILAFTATRWATLVDPKLTPKGEKTPSATDCYRFALSHPRVDACLAGARNGAELDEAMAALDKGPMTADEIAWMRRVGDAVHGKSPSVTRALRIIGS